MEKFFSWKTLGLIFGAFVALGFAVYGYSLNNDFVLWDDTMVIYNNPIIREISPWSIKEAFTTFDPELYVPFTVLSYQMDYLIGGREPLMFHLGNLLLHIINATLVTAILFSLLRKKTLAVLFGIIFLVHPLNTEAVVWASARKDVLASAFFLGSILLYIRSRQRRGKQAYILSIILALFALLSKISAVSLPIVLLLIDYVQRRKLDARLALDKLPYFLLSCIFGIVAIFGKTEVAAESTLSDKIIMAGKSTVFYLEKFLLPVHLSPMYPYNGAISLTSADFFIPWIILILLIAATLFSLRFTRTIVFGASLFLVTLAPSFINFAKGGQFYIASDRYTYLSLLGIFAIIIWLYGFFEKGLRESARKNLRYIAGAACCLLICVYSVSAFKQSLVWRNSFTLFEHVLALDPDTVGAHNNLGVLYLQLKQYDKAMEHFNAANAIRPTADVYGGIGNLEFKRGNYERALEAFDTALSLNPGYPPVHYLKALVLLEQGKQEEAMIAFQTTLELNPYHLGALNNIGALKFQAGEIEGAREAYTEIIEANRYFPDAHFNLALLYEGEGKIDEAISEYEMTLDMEPDSTDALRNLTSLLVEQRHFVRAIEALQASVDAYPEDEETLQIALETAKRILTLDPSNQPTKDFVKKMIDAGQIRY